jgi:hypothetical protein
MELVGVPGQRSLWSTLPQVEKFFLNLQFWTYFFTLALFYTAAWLDNHALRLWKLLLLRLFIRAKRRSYIYQFFLYTHETTTFTNGASGKEVNC